VTHARAGKGRRGADGAQRVARSVPATKLLLVGGFQGFGLGSDREAIGALVRPLWVLSPGGKCGTGRPTFGEPVGVGETLSGRPRRPSFSAA
jgi:hypothetical protein